MSRYRARGSPALVAVVCCGSCVLAPGHAEQASMFVASNSDFSGSKGPGPGPGQQESPPVILSRDKGLYVPLTRRARPGGAVYGVDVSEEGLYRRKLKSGSVSTDEGSSAGSSGDEGTTLEGATGEGSEESTLTLIDYYNNQYVGMIGIGTPLQYLSVVMDTGSSDLWIPGMGCTACGNHATFDGSKSSTFTLETEGSGDELEPKMFEVDYGSGSVLGMEGKDDVSLAGLELYQVLFGLVLYEDQQIRTFMMDGIAGLGFSGLSMVTKPTLLEILHRDHPDVPNMFSVYLSCDPSDTENPSHIMFGGYDLDIVSPNASWHYTPVIRHSLGQLRYWTVKMTGMSVILSKPVSDAVEAENIREGEDVERVEIAHFGGDLDDNFCTSGCYAIVDTGTSGMAIPEAYFYTLADQITEASGAECRGTTCYSTKASDFPDLMIELYPNNRFILRGEDYTVCSRWGVCVVKLQPSFGGEYWILGDVFLEAYYTLFDVKNLRVGFACSGNGCSGGTWHGQGGFMEIKEGFSWRSWVSTVSLVVCLVSAGYLLLSYLKPSCRRSTPRTDYHPITPTAHAVDRGSAGSTSAGGAIGGAGQEGEDSVLGRGWQAYGATDEAPATAGCLPPPAR